ncbi:MAG TPA: threonine/serine exporter family protein [Candidatus Limnocylindria bacterium]|nr:threonine/serine exporter family protein [Candidatus Limnocylindria bacterium]
MDSPRDDRTELLLALSRALHQSGLASDALEDAVREVAIFLRLAVQINALPTTLTLAVGPPFAQRLVVLRLEPGKLNLRKLALLETLILKLREGLEPGLALAEVVRIDAAVPPEPPAQTVLAYALLSCGASLLLGGGRDEVVVSTIGGVAIGTIAALARRYRRIDRVFELAAAFVATLIIALWERFGSPISLYVTLIAGIVQLLPGYSLTTALHELASRNLVSGTSRLGGVLVTLLSLGSGFALGAGLAGNAILNAPTVSPGHTTPGSTILAATLMALAIASILSARYRDVGWIVAACVGTVVLARLFPAVGIVQASPFATAFTIGLVTDLAARYLRISQSVVLVPALLVLVPGSISYESLLYVFQADQTDAVSLGLRALLAAILIVSGFLTSQLVALPSRRELT